MCNYIALAKELKPALTESSSQILKKYYQVCRIKSGRDTSRTTIRMLESLTRIATAHAKLMFHSEVTIDDTLASIDLMNHSLSSDSVSDDRDFTINNKESLDEIAYEKILEDLCLQNRSSMMKNEFKCVKSKKMDKEIMELLNESHENNSRHFVTLQNPTINPTVTASTFTFDLDENLFDDLDQATTQENTPIDSTYKHSKNLFHEKLKEFKK
uniref:DNA helicase MCM9 (Trinotate prediction) n=1 Tax=Myxobolus squamalis TaxID=59785 RepID=A0A6B2G5G9_MYXSQ